MNMVYLSIYLDILISSFIVFEILYTFVEYTLEQFLIWP